MIRRTTTLVERGRRTSIYFRAETRNVAKTELGKTMALRVAEGEAATWPMTMSMEGVKVRRTCPVRLR